MGRRDLKVKIRLEGDGSDADRAIKKTESGFARLTGKIKSSALAQGTAIVAVGIAIRKVVAAVGDWITAANVQEDAIKSLDSALASLGDSAIGISKALQEQAAALQKITKAGDETIIRGQALIANFTKNEEEIKAATVAALDLSAAVGIDLNAAFLLMGKAAAGETSTLTRYGVVLEEGLDKGEKFAATLKLINTQFGGQAAAQTKTYSGLIQQISNAFGDLKETLGAAITKNKELLGVLTNLRDLFTSGKLVEGVVEFAGGIAEAVTNTVNFVKGSAALVQRLDEWGKQQEIVNGINEKANQIDSARSFILTKIYELYSLLPRAVTAYGKATSEAAEAEAESAAIKAEIARRQAEISTALTDSESLLKKWNEAVEDNTVAEKASAEATKAHAKALEEAATAYENAVEAASAFGEVTSVQLANKIVEINTQLIVQKDILGEGTAEYQRYARIGNAQIESLQQRISNLREGLGDLKTETEKVTPAMEELGQSLGSASDESDDLADSMVSVRAKLESAAAAATFTTRAFDDMAKAAGRAAAVNAALASGGTLVNAGPNSGRVRFAGGSRLVRPAGFGSPSGGTFTTVTQPVQTLPNGRIST
jgi:hypothetical protein